MIQTDVYFDFVRKDGDGEDEDENDGVKMLNKEDFEVLIGTLNEPRFWDICEERLAMKKCGNFACGNAVSDANIKKAKGLKF